MFYTMLSFFDTDISLVFSKIWIFLTISLRMDTSVCSNTLTKCQQSYAQIEKVALTIAFRCEQFLQYILKKCELDHKTLQSMLKKSFHHAPARLQKLLHSLQKYNFNVIFKPGKSLFLADTLSIVFLLEMKRIRDCKNLKALLKMNGQKNQENDPQDVRKY